MSNRKSNPVMTPEWFASLLDTCVVPDGESTAPPPHVNVRGDGGMSFPGGIELIDMHTRSEDMLLAGSVTVEEVKELADALHRLARKWTEQPPSKIQCDNPPERADHTPLGPPAKAVDFLARKCSRCGAYKDDPEIKCHECEKEAIETRFTKVKHALKTWTSEE